MSRSNRDFSIGAFAFFAVGLLSTAFMGTHDLILISFDVALFVLYIAWVIHWIPRWRREARLKKGRCEFCGYNLTGNISGTCPECGKPAAKAQQQITMNSN
ncbi:MAG TPA: hypothetical protein VK797_14695 [Tepidisphaeraceae bacterium]|nr:hypothetical protein [Tepidisphaeraceae bacterium]